MSANKRPISCANCGETMTEEDAKYHWCEEMEDEVFGEEDDEDTQD